MRNKFFNRKKILACCISITFGSCISEKPLVKPIRESNFTKIATVCFQKPLVNDTILIDREPSDKEIRQLNRILEEKLYYFKRELPIKFPKTKIQIKNSNGLNARILRKTNEPGEERRKTNLIIIDLGILRKSIKNSLLLAEENNLNNNEDSSSLFTSNISNASEYYYYLLNYEPKKTTVFTFLDDDEFFSNELTDLLDITVNATSELDKILTWVVFHEAGHIVNDCVDGKRCELNADLTALKAYHYLFGMRQDSNGELVMGSAGWFGRDLDELVAGIYKNTTFEEPENLDRPSLQERLQQIDSLNQALELDLEKQLFKLFMQ